MAECLVGFLGLAGSLGLCFEVHNSGLQHGDLALLRLPGCLLLVFEGLPLLAFFLGFALCEGVILQTLLQTTCCTVLGILKRLLRVIVFPYLFSSIAFLACLSLFSWALACCFESLFCSKILASMSLIFV